MSKTHDDLLFRGDVADLDPYIAHMIEREAERQARKLIMIPSESYAPLAVRQALGSVFQNIYAEGYPPLRAMREPEALLLDDAHQLVYYRRYADRRFYKGVDYVDIVEALAGRRAAQCFANDLFPAEAIHANVQALSGTAANLSIYDTFMEAGDTLMGLDLFQGGHLSHGSEFNISGKRYHVVSYGVTPKSEQLDYDQIMALALAHRPRIIVAGYTSYTWAPDWQKFREIADAAGALLMADIAHTAGLVIGGVYPT
jgi:glycine hydroxymethyltransferase